MESCSYLCTAESYLIDELARYLREEHWDPKFYGDVIYLKPQDSDQEIFIFSYGCLCFWGDDIAQVDKLVELIKPFEVNSLKKNFDDHCFYSYGDHIGIDEEKDSITLESQDNLLKLSFAYAFTQSVKLESFESIVDNTIKETRHIPEELAKFGKIALPARKISQQIGELFMIRSSITFHSDLLDLPEFFWRLPKYEPYYHMASKYMDITARLDVLNRRLDIIHELYGVLSEEFKHQKSMKLELYIVILIVVEVVLSSFHLFSPFFKK